MPQSHLPQITGYLRLPQVLEILPVSRSTWYRGIKSGRYPKSVKLSTRAVGWKIEDITNCVSELENASSPPWN
jgi:prophage regulatory protein